MAVKKKQADKVDKRYRARVQIPGTDKAVWVSGKTKKELAEKVEETKNHLIYGEKVDDVPFVDMIREWWEVVKLPGIRAHSTRINWEATLRNHVLPYFDSRKMCRAVTRRDLQACLDRLEGRAKVVICQAHGALVGTCRYALVEGIINRDPSTMLSRPTAKEVESKGILTTDQERALLDTLARSDEREQLLVGLLYYTGMRRSEACGLMWSDIDFDKKLIHVTRDIDFTAARSDPRYVGKVKTAASVRFIPILDDLMKILKAHRGLPNQFIISGSSVPTADTQYHTSWNKFCLDAGMAVISDTHTSSAALNYGIKKELTAHWLRHHFVSSCMIAGLRPDYVKLIAGHSDFNTTLNVYTHILHNGEVINTLLSEQISAGIASLLPESLRIATFFK